MLSWKKSIASQATASTRSPLRTIVSPRSQDLTTSSTPSAARLCAWSVSSAENEELGTTSGWISAAPSDVSVALRSPAKRISIPSRIDATSVSRSSARATVSSTLIDSARTASQRSGSRARRVSRSSVPIVFVSTPARITARSSGVTAVANAASIGAVSRSNSRTCCAATDAPRAIVKSYCGSTASRAAWRARSVRISLVYSAARGAWTLVGAGLPCSSSAWAGRKSRPRTIDMAATSSADAAISRPASRRVNWLLADSVELASIVRRLVSREGTTQCSVS